MDPALRQFTSLDMGRLKAVVWFMIKRNMQNTLKIKLVVIMKGDLLVLVAR